MLRNLNQSSGGRRILGVPHVGILAATIAGQTATGDNGPGLLYDESISPANAGKQLRLVVTAHPVAGAFFAYENGSFDFSGAPNGTYSIGYNWLADNVLAGSDSATINVGVVDATAPGAALNGASSIAPGVATGQQNATASGATLNGTSTLDSGSATGDSGAVHATAPGANITGVSSLQSGAATGQKNATAPGASLSSTSTLSAGTATGGSGNIDAVAPGASLTGHSTFIPGTASVPGAPGEIIMSVAHGRVAGILLGQIKPIYTYGEMARLAALFVDIEGTHRDPENLRLKIIRPDGAPEEITPIRYAVGQYHHDLPLDKKGTWYYRWESTAPLPAAAEGSLTVQPSRFIQS